MNIIFRLTLELVLCSLFVTFIFPCRWRNETIEVPSSINKKSTLNLKDELASSTSISSSEDFLAVRGTVATELFRKVKLLCWIMTSPDYHWTRARHVKLTWGRRCNKLVFISTSEDERIPTVKIQAEEGYDTLWGKTREGFRYVWQKYHDEFDWFLKADDDSYIILENLRYFLSPFNSSQPLYFGHRFRAYVKNGYMQGGSGYILSREALRRFVEVGLNESSQTCDSSEWPEDVRMGQCMQNLSCKAMDTRDYYGRERFLPLALESHLTIGLTDNTWFWEIHPSYYPLQQGYKCCSDTAIGFHKVSPDAMHLFEYLVYYLHPYGIRNIREDVQPSPFPSPDSQGNEPAFVGPSNETLAQIEVIKEREESQRSYKTSPAEPP